MMTCATIEDTRYRVAVYVNSEACRMNWHVGMRIKEDVLHNACAEYGKQAVKHLAERLVKRYGNGWGFKKLQHCLCTAYTFSETENHIYSSFPNFFNSTLLAHLPINYRAGYQ